MRIIDKEYDYYDYLQTSEDKIVFDRRNSFLLTKEKVIEGIKYTRYNRDSKYRFILLQCGATYWLFLLTITAYKDTRWCSPSISDYSLELLSAWKNFNKRRKVIDIHVVSFRNFYIFYDHDFAVYNKDFSVDKIRARVNDLRNSIDTNNYEEDRDLSLSYLSVRELNDTERNIPLLKACGIAQLVDSADIFYAIEEHFSLEKSEAERTEAGGTTNNDKITMHGFDVKTSFRGKHLKGGELYDSKFTKKCY